MNSESIRTAFAQTHEGFSSDRVIADPSLNEEFVSACRTLGLSETARDLNHALMNLRKTGTLGVATTAQTRFDDEEYVFASEIAIRMLERRDGVTLDDVLCDPSAARELDEIASMLAPGFASLQYRWAALSLRKRRGLAPEVASRVLRAEDANIGRLTELEIANIPDRAGIYVFVDMNTKEVLYIGETTKLRRRLQKHVEHSDNRYLARRLWSGGPEQVVVEYYVLSDDVSSRERRAIEIEQIRTRSPAFNIVGAE